MKVLHAAYSSDPAPGVARQMAAEQDAATRLGIDWQARFFVPAGTAGDVCVEAGAPAGNRLAFKREYYRWLAEAMRGRDLLLLRYLRYDPLQLWFLRRARHPVVLVHHTLEGPQIVQEGGRAAALKLRLDDALVRRCHAYGAGLIAVTDEIARYECARGARPPARWIYPNGIVYDDAAEPGEPASGGTGRASAEPIPGPDDGAPAELLFVASRFVDWHGLDLVIDAATRSAAPFRLHVVGALEDGQRAALAADRRFVAHGRLDASEVERLAARCSLGLGSFALHRKDMHQACTLKVREYLRAGLPVYAGHADVFGPAMRWYRHGECDLDAMLDYLRECAGTSRRQIAREARPWIDKEVLLERLHRSLSEGPDARRATPPLAGGRERSSA